MVVPVVAASTTVVCGGPRELPKSSGSVLQSLQPSLLLRLRVGFGFWYMGESYDDGKGGNG